MGTRGMSALFFAVCDDGETTEARLISDRSPKSNGTDLRTLINTNQSLCRGFGGGTRPKMRGLGGSPPDLVSPKN